jgi:hypothetical protein
MPEKRPQPRRTSPDANIIHLRLDEGLRERLRQEAERHRFTVTNEIRVRLLDSFDADSARSLTNIRLDMEVCWARFSARFLRMDLGDQLADAVAKGEDLAKIKTLARLIIEHRATEQRAAGVP